MRTICILTVLASVASSGCTTVSLNQYTRSQNKSYGKCRDDMVLECLASVAAEPATLPSYAIISNGSTNVTDSVTLGQTAVLAPLKYTLETLALTGSRAPKALWTVSPLVEYEKLMALHAACLWGIFDSDYSQKQYPDGILGYQRDYLDQNPHFAVADRLAKIPHGWLHIGSLKEVPLCARYKGHKGNTWVWVMPEDSEAFAQFTLVLQDIATLDISAGYGTPLLVTLTTYEVTRLPDTADKTKAVTIATSEVRAVKKDYQDIVSKAIQDGLKTGTPVALSRAQWLEYTDQWFGFRSAHNWSGRQLVESHSGESSHTTRRRRNPSWTGDKSIGPNAPIDL